jgi:hypothetical protein
MPGKKRLAHTIYRRARGERREKMKVKNNKSQKTNNKQIPKSNYQMTKKRVPVV